MANKPDGSAFLDRLNEGVSGGYEIISVSVYVGGFISGIKVYTYADEHGPERKMILSA